MTRALVSFTTLILAPASLLAQRPVLTAAVRSFVAVDTPVVVLTHAWLIDGTGAPTRENQSIVIEDGRITAVGAAVAIPAGALVIDLAGKTVTPGFAMVHEHLFYPAGPGVYGNYAESFVKLYLAGGVTSMRTGGNMNGYGEINIAKAIARGDKPGPWIDATAPYLNGPNPFGQMQALETPAAARRFVDFWADQGATSFKAYMQIRREVLGAAIDRAHKRGIKVTGHLCSVTYREAARLGIDDLEHGFIAATDFVGDKKPDECPGQNKGATSVNSVEPESTAFTSLVAELIRHQVAITSTPTVFETFVPGRPRPPGLEVLIPEQRASFERVYTAVSKQTQSLYTTLYPRDMALERAFVKAGGTLLVGTDPTGGGGVIPGFSNQRAVELLVEAGFTVEAAIKIATSNGAVFMGRGVTVGTIEPGKQADLLVIGGNLAAQIADIRKVELVFKQGIGYDPAKLIASVTGKVGLY